jgi:hypothetical protein
MRERRSYRPERPTEPPPSGAMPPLGSGHTAELRERVRALETTLRAVRARLDGEFDHPALLAYGPLHHDPLVDVRRIIVVDLPPDGRTR